MILRKDQPESVQEEAGPGSTVTARRISDAGGLTQFGTHIHTLTPGALSSERHWHSAEDELLYVLAGQVTVIDDDGEHQLDPGDVACWPAGEPNAHQVANRSDAPCTFLICGSRVPRGIIHYPDLGRVVHFEGPTWKMIGEDGELVKTSE